MNRLCNWLNSCRLHQSSYFYAAFIIKCRFSFVYKLTHWTVRQMLYFVRNLQKGVPMSGTQDLNLAAKEEKLLQTDRSGTGQLNEKTSWETTREVSQETFQKAAQEAAAEESEQEEKELTPSQKMDALIRGTSSGYMKKELERLRKEAAKYRNSTKIENQAKLELQAKAEEISKELEALKAEHTTLSIIQKLDKAGCVKSELVAKDIPSDLSSSEELDNFIRNYKEENKFLFKTPKQNAGGVFKSSGRKNLTPSQQMDAYIRAALGR